MTEITEPPRLPPRDASGHKGDYGRVLVVAGSRGMSGAAVLTGTAVMRSGAGLCTVACPASIQNVVAAGFPCYTTHAVSDEGIADVTNLAARFDVVAIGPGLGQSIPVKAMLLVDKPIVIDADGLNALAPLTADTFKSRTQPTVLTPHPGEFARLTSKPTPTTDEDRLSAAADLARTHGVVVLLKGNRTVVTDGERYYFNTTGNPGMATGGSGDVLTGIIAALIGQKLSAFDAAMLGAYVHGHAGDLAAGRLGQVGMTAVDILHDLAEAFR